MLAAASLWAQDKVVSVRIFTDPPGVFFVVDGERYAGAATFLWPEKSKHLLSAASPQIVQGNVAYLFKEWRDSREIKLLDGPVVAITADRDITSYKAVWLATYAITLDLNVAGANLPFACLPGPPWGKVYINVPEENSCYITNVVLWGDAGKQVTVQVHPPEGYAFVGWSMPVNGSQAPILSFVLDRPVLLQPRFEAAVRMRLETSPPGLQVLADRTPVTTPITLDWASGTSHMLGAVSPQRDGIGAQWVFDSWSDGGAQHHSYTAGPVNVPVTLTAQYLPGVAFGLVTNPPGLKLSIDGRTNWPGYNFVWAAGSRHTVSAPLEQTDARGRRYVFRSWAHGGEATQEVVAGDSGGWMANYEPLAKLTIRTSPADLAVLADGAECKSPCVIDRLPGAEVRLAAPASAEPSEGTRLDFEAWSDGASMLRTVKVGSDLTLTAAYRSSYRLSAMAEPDGGADLRLEPVSGDGYYPAGARVAVVAEPRPGYRFRRWEGDLSGTLRSGVVTMTAPRLVQAVLERLPAAPPAVVRNAAGETPESGVAPGSIISIYGADLAPAYQAGPRGPLAQTIGGVAVRVGDRILPLFFVSPEQVNAQLPSSLAEGDYSLAVVREGRPDTLVEFRVVRNAPGLFAGEQGTALAAHSDGEPVTPEKPARRGETVTIFGTGFGPYERSTPDGFPVPDGAPLPLADAAQVLIVSLAVEPQFAGAAPGEVGVAAVRFRIPEELPAAPAVEVRIRINAKESNAVLLPLE